MARWSHRVVLGVSLVTAGAPGQRDGLAAGTPLLPPSRNLGIEMESFVASPDHVIFRAREFIQRGDLTGDGDQFDWPAYHYDVRTQRLVELAPNVRQRAGELPVVIEGDWAAFQAAEAGVDLNGDGDGVDLVVHLLDLARGTRTNLALATDNFNFQQFVLREGVLALLVSERVAGTFGDSGQGMDLNGDGDRFDHVLFLHRLATGVTTNTGLCAGSMWVADGLLLTNVFENVQGADLNGDGDRADSVVQLVRLDSGAVQNLGIVGTPLDVRGRRALITVSESQGGQDLNGDGDTLDAVLHTYDVDAGTLVNHGLWAARSRGASSSAYELPDGDGRFLALYVAESAQGTDLNGDGDLGDFVLHVYDYEHASVTNTGFAVVQGGATLSFPAITGGRLRFWVDETQQGTDLNGDGDAFDAVFHLRELLTGVTTNLGLAESPGGTAYSQANGRHIAFLVNEQSQGLTDLNGDGDIDDRILCRYDAKLGTLESLGANRVSFTLTERFLVFTVAEEDEQADLNGDGDAQDDVVHLQRLETGVVYNLGLATFRPGVAVAADHLVVGVNELDQGNADLNGNGLPFETVAHVVPLFGRRPF